VAASLPRAIDHHFVAAIDVDDLPTLVILEAHGELLTCSDIARGFQLPTSERQGCLPPLNRP
jgi:hypothetical protein